MITRVVTWYARRIVNVNINIVLAGVLALFPVLLVVRITEHLMATRQFKNGVLQDQLETHQKAIIPGITFLADITFDLMIYFALHWFANHSPKLIMLRKQQIEGVADAAAENVPFFKDAAKVQMQRAVLSPLLYILWLGSQFILMHKFDLQPVWATVFGFVLGIGTARGIHTAWMLWEERKRTAIASGHVCAKCGHDLAGLPDDALDCPECGAARGRPGIAASPSPGDNGRQSLSEKGVKSVSRS